MNLLSQMQAIFGSEERAYATIKGIKSDGTLIAQTPSGATVLLQGKSEIGKAVYYDRVSNKVLSDAPIVTFNEYSV